MLVGHPCSYLNSCYGDAIKYDNSAGKVYIFNFCWLSTAEFVNPEIVQQSIIKCDWFSTLPTDPDSLVL